MKNKILLAVAFFIIVCVLCLVSRQEHINITQEDNKTNSMELFDVVEAMDTSANKPIATNEIDITNENDDEQISDYCFNAPFSMLNGISMKLGRPMYFWYHYRYFTLEINR